VLFSIFFSENRAVSEIPRNVEKYCRTWQATHNIMGLAQFMLET